MTSGKYQRQDKQWVCPRCGANVLQSQRHRDSCGKLSKHCGCCVRINHVLTPDQMAEHTRNRINKLKREHLKRKAAKEGREFIPKKYRVELDNAHVLCLEHHSFELKAAPKRLHDAHVKKYRQALSARASAAKRYASNPVAERLRQSKRKEALPDSYVIQNLKAMGIPPSQVTPPLVALKREAMQYRRMSNSIKAAIKTQFKENK